MSLIMGTTVGSVLGVTTILSPVLLLASLVMKDKMRKGAK